MGDATQEQKGPAQEISPAAVVFVRSFSMVFNQLNLYGVGHAVTHATISKSFTSLCTLLKDADSVNIAIAEDALIVDGVTFDSETPIIRSFVERMAKLDIASFSLDRGIPQEEFNGIVELLCATPAEMKQAGGFATVLESLGLKHVRAKKVTYQRVTEDEVVVGKGKLAQAVGANVDTDRIMKFLKGEVTDVNADDSRAIDNLSGNISELSGLLLDAAGAGGGKTASKDVEMADDVVAVLRRLYRQFAGSQRAQTQKGKKDLIKLIEELEKGVAIEIDKRAGQDTDAAKQTRERLTQAADEMIDELRIDSLATEYARKKGGIQSIEKRILRFVMTAEKDTLQKSGLVEKLLDEGVSADEVSDLLEKYGVDMGGAGTGSGAAGDALRKEWQGLSAELTQISNTLTAAGAIGGGGAGGGFIGGGTGTGQGGDGTGGSGQGTGSGSGLGGDGTGGFGPGDGGGGAGIGVAQPQVPNAGEIVTRTAEVVTGMTTVVSKQIEVFAERIKPAKDGKRKPALSRKALYEFLAEIIQELRQPLSVINSVMSAVGSGMMGQVTPTQKNMLGLAGESATRLDVLINKLAELFGMPKGLTPDSKILGTVYGRKSGADNGIGATK